MESRNPAAIEKLHVMSIVLLSLMLIATQGRSEITETKDSSEFGIYQHEMVRKPSSEDIDSNGT